MLQQVYHSSEIQAWEQRWFKSENSVYGLMQQVAWQSSRKIVSILSQHQLQQPRIAVCCGQGNNAGDGFLIATYLQQYMPAAQVRIFVQAVPQSASAQLAYQAAVEQGIGILPVAQLEQQFDVYIDALFGIGLNRPLSEGWIKVIENINYFAGLKIAVDIPSGLNANTGRAMPVAVKADYTLTALGLKIGLYTGQGKEFAGDVQLLDLIPVDHELQSLATLSPQHVYLPARQAFQHKGSFGHVLIVGGHADMGGAAIMAAEAAFHAGAGKVTIACDARHHVAVLSRAPNIMVRDINALDPEQSQQLIDHVDAVCFGMGLGRDEWAGKVYQQWFPQLNQSQAELVLDADALWFLAKQPQRLKAHSYATPHPGEAATLLGMSPAEIEQDRVNSIYALQQKYDGEWVLKGSGSLILQGNALVKQLWVCTAGNAGMGTGGMGDVLAGMIGSLKAQYQSQIELQQIVTLHALAGDYLAQRGQRGLQAHQMADAIYQVVNHAHA